MLIPWLVYTTHLNWGFQGALEHLKLFLLSPNPLLPALGRVQTELWD